jgi:serine/threonine protein kinase
MGVVYRATDPAGRDVAIKIIRPELAADPTARQRLAREIDTMRRVRSPYVADVLDGDATADRPYVVTRFVDGRQLDKVIAEDGPLREDALRRLALGLAKALVAIHRGGVVHRDLKPSNTMLVNGEPVVIDFGIARSSDSAPLTQTGMLTGTPGYMAPEIFDDQQASPASDVHAWAATVAFAATGRMPFGTGGFKAVILNVLEGRADLDGVPQALMPLLRAALNRDPARRPSGAALVDAVAALGGDPASRSHDAVALYEQTAMPPGNPPRASAPTHPSTTPQFPGPGYEPYPPRRASSGGPRGTRSARKWVLAAGGVALATILIAGGFALRGAVSDGETAARTLPPSASPSEVSTPSSAPGAVASPSSSELAGPSSPPGLPSHRSSTHRPAGTPTFGRPRSHTSTSRPTPSETSRVVTPGAFCSPEGATGVTSAGTPMRCVRKEGEEQARWRSAQ